MDEPTEGLAPVIVTQVEEMLVRLAEEGEMAVLVIEQNIGVATAISENVAIMVNGRINRVIEAPRLAADRALQQRLLGVGRHGHDDTPLAEPAAGDGRQAPPARPARRRGRASTSPIPYVPTRWSQPVPVATDRGGGAHHVGEQRLARRGGEPARADIRPLAAERRSRW